MARSAPESKSTAASSEIGEGDFAIDYNARTGRPIRKARKSGSPFVDSAVVVLSADDEIGSDIDIDIPPPSKGGRKRKRKPSTSPPVDAVPDPTQTETEGDDEIVVASRKPLDGAPVQLTISNVAIHLPPGHTGPIMLHIDPTTTAQPGHAASPDVLTPSIRVAGAGACGLPTVSPHRAGFLDLPAELRNTIYDLAFVADARFNFGNPTNFRRSAAVLRTCRQVYEEGRSVLYSSNRFYFNRRTARYGSYWESEWRELGYKHIRHFLDTIGPTNMALIRHLSFSFEDATPCLNPDGMTHEERRFVNDEHLMPILRQLANHAKLESLSICFHGRRRVETSDRRLLDIMKRIKADEVHFVSHPVGISTEWATESKQEDAVRHFLLKNMVRKQRLYK